VLAPEGMNAIVLGDEGARAGIYCLLGRYIVQKRK